MANKNIALFESAEVRDVLRDLVGEAFVDLMELEVEARTGAAHGERSEERKNSRNGYRDRLYKSRVGDLELRIPKLRKGSYIPSFLEPRRTVEKALDGSTRSWTEPADGDNMTMTEGITSWDTT